MRCRDEHWGLGYTEPCHIPRAHKRDHRRLTSAHGILGKTCAIRHEEDAENSLIPLARELATELSEG